LVEPFARRDLGVDRGGGSLLRLALLALETRALALEPRELAFDPRELVNEASARGPQAREQEQQPGRGGKFSALVVPVLI
jgi:hypothetical protein